MHMFSPADGFSRRLHRVTGAEAGWGAAGPGPRAGKAAPRAACHFKYGTFSSVFGVFVNKSSSPLFHEDVLALCQSVSRETHKMWHADSSLRVGDAQFL